MYPLQIPEFKVKDSDWVVIQNMVCYFEEKCLKNGMKHTHMHTHAQCIYQTNMKKTENESSKYQYKFQTKNIRLKPKDINMIQKYYVDQ